MPKVLKKSRDPGNSNVLNMMGYGEDLDNEDDTANNAFEQELAAIMGGNPSKKKEKKQPPKKLVDWAVLDAQIKESLRDVDDDGDVDVNSDDESDLMDELNDIVGEDNTLAVSTVPVRRSPSPIPPKAASDILSLLVSRKEMYELGIQQSTMSSKTRRLERGLKQINEMITKAKRGKSIDEESIPPPVAVKTTNAPRDTKQDDDKSVSTTRAGKISFSMDETSTELVVPVIRQPEPPSPALRAPIAHSTSPVPPSPIPVQAEVPSAVVECSVSASELSMLEERKNEYKVAAMKAKNENNRELALNHFRMLKQIDFIITSAKEGKTVDLTQMPSSPSESDSQKSAQPTVEVKQTATAGPSHASDSSKSGTLEEVKAQPKTPVEHLTVRLQVYQTSASEATKEGNSSKARRMMRIVKQYQTALKAHNAGKNVNFDELPCPPGFPPIPGQSQQQPMNIMERANQLANADPDAEDADESDKSTSSAKTLVARQPAAGASPVAAAVASGSVSTSSKSSAPKAQSAYNAQITFLENRQSQFRQAALQAKQDGNRELALSYLRKMKGFDNLIAMAKSGVKVDISKCPQPPILSKHDGEFEIIEKREVVEKNYGTLEAKDDGELYSRIVSILTQQVEKARSYSEQMSHACDVRSAQVCDALATSSQADLDYIVSCRRHKDPPPRFFYVEKELKCMDINPDIGENELELVIVQCLGVAPVVKDNKVYIEWEMPFPHGDPIKGQTEEAKPSPKPQFDATIRVPFTRKQKSNQRAIKSKSLKLNLVAKGGFMRSSKTLGTCNVKLAQLDTLCSFHAIENLKDGRNEVGQIEVKVKLRTPITSSGPKTVTVKWMSVEQKVLKPSARAAPKPAAPSKSSSSKSPSSKPHVNISSIQAAMIDFKIVSAQIDHHKKRGQQVPREMLLEAKRIKNQIDSTRSYIQEGGRETHREYYNCLSAQYKFLAQQSDKYEKEGKPGKAKVARKKKEAVGAELQKYSS